MPWTHISGTIRYDNRTLERHQQFKEIRYITDILMEGPEGSEGGMEYEVVPQIDLKHKGNLTVSSSSLVTIVFWGDLRHFELEKWPEIEAWWKRLTSEEDDLRVRQGVMLVENSYARITHITSSIYEEENV